MRTSAVGAAGRDVEVVLRRRRRPGPACRRRRRRVRSPRWRRSTASPCRRRRPSARAPRPASPPRRRTADPTAADRAKLSVSTVAVLSAPPATMAGALGWKATTRTAPACGNDCNSWPVAASQTRARPSAAAVAIFVLSALNDRPATSAGCVSVATSLPSATVHALTVLPAAAPTCEAVPADGHGRHGVRQRAERLDRLAGREVPELDRLVGAAGNGLHAVGQEGAAGDAAGVGVDDAEHVHVGQANGLVGARRNQSAIVREEGQRPHRPGVVAQRQQFLAAWPRRTRAAAWRRRR